VGLIGTMILSGNQSFRGFFVKIGLPYTIVDRYSFLQDVI